MDQMNDLTPPLYPYTFSPISGTLEEMESLVNAEIKEELIIGGRTVIS